MANIGTFVFTNMGFQKVSTLAEITFDENNLYEIQNQGGDIMLRAGTEGTGEILGYKDVRNYETAGSDDLYIAPLYPNSGREIKINISARAKRAFD